MVFLVTSGTIDPTSVPAVVFLSISGGFAAIWLLGLAALPRTTHPWPLAPALVLGLVGTAFAARQPMALEWIQAAVAIALVAGGAAMVLRRHAPVTPAAVVNGPWSDQRRRPPGRPPPPR